MEIRKEIIGNVMVIYLTGNLLGENANGPVLDFIKANIELGNKKLMLNLTDLKYINSTGLGMLISAQTRVRNAGGEMVMVSAPEILKKLLTMMKLDTTFVLVETEKAGLDLLN